MGRPHEMVGGVADGIAGTVKGIGNSVKNMVVGLGGQVTRALDKPLEATIHKQGPHHIVDDVATGTINAASGLADSGITALQNEGHSIMKALDEPPKQFNLPPDLGGDMKKPSFKMPSFLGKK